MEPIQQNNLETIDLHLLWERFFKSLKRTWLVVLALTVLLGGINYFRSARAYTPRYSCRAIFSIGSGYVDDSIFLSGTLYYDSAAASELAEAFPELLKTDYMRDMIRLQLGTEGINGSISAAAIAETNLMELQVTSSSAQDAYDILNAVIACYPQAARYMANNPQIQLLDAPVLPTEPSNRFSAKDAVRNGGMLGLLLGLVLTLALTMQNRSVGNADELKMITNLPILAAFPLVVRKKRRVEVKTFISAADNDGITEALRGLRTKLRKQLAEKNGKIVLLTSTIPGEGKTTISANLAISMAAEGRRVVLVDADLRNQTIARLFHGAQEDDGLMYCLKNPDASAMDCLKSIPGTKLHYISGGSTGKRHYAIDAKAMRRVLDELAENFDYVIIDTPPCSVVSDTAILARFADTVLYVVRMNCANRNQIMDGITGLYQREIPLGGCIINGAEGTNRRYGYGYGYGYGYRYGGYGKYGSSKYGKSKYSRNEE